MGGKSGGGDCGKENLRNNEEKRRPHQRKIGVLAQRLCDLGQSPHSQRIPDSTRLANTLLASPTSLLGTVSAGPRFF